MTQSSHCSGGGSMPWSGEVKRTLAACVRHRAQCQEPDHALQRVDTHATPEFGKGANHFHRPSGCGQQRQTQAKAGRSGWQSPSRHSDFTRWFRRPGFILRPQPARPSHHNAAAGLRYRIRPPCRPMPRGRRSLRRRAPRGTEAAPLRDVRCRPPRRHSSPKPSTGSMEARSCARSCSV